MSAPRAAGVAWQCSGRMAAGQRDGHRKTGHPPEEADCPIGAAAPAAGPRGHSWVSVRAQCQCCSHVGKAVRLHGAG